MDAQRDIVLVSVFGRSNWLALELSQLGLNVTLVDLSEQFGHWAPEDWEGPFGLFQSELLSQSMMARLHEEDYFDSVDEGFVIWLPTGPIDLMGTHSAYLLEKNGISVEALNYIQRFDSLNVKDKQKIKKEFEASSFRASWFVELSHQLASPAYYSNTQGLKSVRPLPLFSPLSIRRVSRKGYERSLSYVESKNVNVVRKARLKDIYSVKKQIESLEVESPHFSGVLLADQFVMSMSSSELLHISKRLSEQLKPSVIEPAWVWMRYRFELTGTDLISTLPKKMVVINDLDLNWTHSNLALVQKTVSENEFDFWLRLPNAHRFNRDYLEKIGADVLQKFKARIPDCQSRVVSLPQESQYDYSTLGPSRYPIYNENDLKSVKGSSYYNLHFDSPEQWDLLDFTGQHLHQKTIFENIRNWKMERDQKRARLEAQAAQKKG